MSPRAQDKRPLGAYLSLSIALLWAFMLVVVLRGGVDISLGPLKLQAHDLTSPALLLLALLVVRWFAVPEARDRARGKGRGGWKEAFFGPTGGESEAWRAAEILLILVAAWTLFAGAAATARHGHFDSTALGLGAVDQALWNSLGGKLFETTLAGGDNYLGMHFAPGIAPLALASRLRPGPGYLLWLQAFLLALGAWPAYLIARRRLESRRWGLAVAGLYLAHPMLREAALGGFHPGSLALPFLLFALLLLEEKLSWAGYVMLCIALFCGGEQFWLAVSFLGLYIALVRRRFREGLFLFFIALYGYVFIVMFLSPRFGGDAAARMLPYGHLGGSAAEIAGAVVARPAEVWSLVLEPGRVAWLMKLFLPLGFLPLLGPLALLGALPALALQLLAGAPGRFSADLSWGLAALPFLVAAAARGLANVKSGWGLREMDVMGRPLFGWLLLTAALVGFGPSPALHFRGGPPAAYGEELRQAAAMVPHEALLAAQDNLVPHLSRRPSLVRLPAVEGAEYVIADLQGEHTGGVSPERYYEILAALLWRDRYGLLFQGEHIVLLSRDAGDKSVNALRTLEEAIPVTLDLVGQ